MKRLDSALVEWGMAPSRTKAQAMISAGEVEVKRAGQWQLITDRSFNAEGLRSEDVRVKEGTPVLRYVSRGGLKLEAAAERIGLQVRGRRCLDIGISTGGFSDFLLQSGASAVLGIDVGRGQLHERLRSEPRLTAIEELNVKDMGKDPRVKEWLNQGVDLCVIDVSFISLQAVLPILGALLPVGGELLALVKPQFEVGRQKLRPEMIEGVRNRTLHALANCGFTLKDYFPSGVKGQDGTQEYFVWAVRG